MKNLAFIPARSGSKGLKDKNIKNMNGKPLLAYSIEAAKESGLFNKIFVSTDSPLYAEIAKTWGGETPFLRTESLSTDTASVWNAISETLSIFKKNNEKFDNVCLLQPTSPLRTGGDIVDSYKIFTEKNADSVISITETEHSPLLCNTLNANMSLHNFISQETVMQGRQSRPIYYRINGAIYWIKTELLYSKLEIYGEKSYGYIMEQEKSVDIDNEIDFLIAETLLKNQKKIKE